MQNIRVLYQHEKIFRPSTYFSVVLTETHVLNNIIIIMSPLRLDRDEVMPVVLFTDCHVSINEFV